MKYHCCDLRRLSVLRRSGSANAIEFIEVLDKDAPASAPRQQTLFVRLLRDGFTIAPDNLKITGGERIRSVGVVWSAPADALPPEAEPGLVDTVGDPARTLVIRTDSSGDFSVYTLSIVANSGSANPPNGFDPILSSIYFSFKVECPADFDCADNHSCPPDARSVPDIDYLARDFQGFRRLMLDRLNLLVPGWTERSAADLGVMLVELLAYAADNLSYRQDAIAGEAYLATARQRISVRRHARLVDYFMHEGCNARAFVHFNVADADTTLAARTQLLTEVPGLPRVIAPGSVELARALAANPLIFETTHQAELHSQVNRMSFYSWGDNGCCLPKGATSATLRNHLDKLEVGDILIFEEVASPTTFSEDDADLTHRWAIRLTGVLLSVDPSGQLFDEPPVDGPVDVTEIIWDAADALPFALCLSVEDRPGLEISVALGNIVLVDHGATIKAEPLGEVPEPGLEIAAAERGCGCDAAERAPLPPRFRPSLKDSPLTHGFDLPGLLSVPIDPDQLWWPASSLLAIDARSAKPLVTELKGTLGIAPPEMWTVQRDLLSSASGTTDFVVEVEDDGTARLRFGDDERGKRPDPGTAFEATYRVGNGAVGNVGAEAIFHIVSASNGLFDVVRNPMPAAGGTEPESMETVRRDAPQSFRTQERAVTAADYAAAAERRPDVQRAAATFRWTGSWHTVFVIPDRFGGGEIDAPFRTRLRRHLERFRMAGYDLDVSSPRYVPLDIGLHVCVKADYFRSDVLRAVQQALSSTVHADGALGLFHPDNFTFGQPAYLSRVIAAAQSVEGVEAVRAERFQRLVSPDATSLDEGVIDIGGLEIAQLANNPNFRERGKLEIRAGGGK